MLEPEAVALLKALQTSDDPEAAHAEADRILCELLRSYGLDEAVEAWENVSKWYA